MSRLPMLLLLSGCSAAFAGLEIDPVRAPVRARDDAPQLFAELPGHGETVRTAANAALAGDRVGVARALGPLRDQFTHGAVPAEQRVYVYGIVDRVPMAVHGRTDDDVRRGVGLLLAWCGDCHVASGVTTPPRSAAASARPAGHAALADLAVDAALWPDGPAWDALATRPRAVRDEAMLAVLSALGDLPRDPTARATTAVRAEAFRRVGGACADCHAREALAAGG